MADLTTAKNSPQNLKPEEERVGRWWLSGFGGFNHWGGRTSGSWERLMGRCWAMQNGSYLQISIRMPGQDRPSRLSLLQSELRELLAKPHGERTILWVETDEASDIAYAEHRREFPRVPAYSTGQEQDSRKAED